MMQRQPDMKEVARLCKQYRSQQVMSRPCNIAFIFMRSSTSQFICRECQTKNCDGDLLGMISTDLSAQKCHKYAFLLASFRLHESMNANMHVFACVRVCMLIRACISDLDHPIATSCNRQLTLHAADLGSDLNHPALRWAWFGSEVR